MLHFCVTGSDECCKIYATSRLWTKKNKIKEEKAPPLAYNSAAVAMRLRDSDNSVCNSERNSSISANLESMAASRVVCAAAFISSISSCDRLGLMFGFVYRLTYIVSWTWRIL